ncbi:hypothetical protein C4K29_5344 [Pseudomonas chlororaphis subsp. piscium]|nr:hypothetical protein C4K33_5046 [Pseudomonas chlororaphis subsp. piscium]AZC71752.1 hypothetical protein C4K32_5114 [Pseudomonas chlororaphis subsp. piscium]AZC91621.1 hypothetical protein C4K29_5344 [Pseudomonas chlororaphis subsp. piscium]
MLRTLVAIPERSRSGLGFHDMASYTSPACAGPDSRLHIFEKG